VLVLLALVFLCGAFSSVSRGLEALVLVFWCGALLVFRAVLRRSFLPLRSTDAGRTWSALPNAGVRDWTGVAVSGNSALLVALVGSHGDGSSCNIFTSSDSGVSWAPAAVCASETGVCQSDWCMPVRLKRLVYASETDETPCVCSVSERKFAFQNCV
jgi:hypothetical protein